jgi:hypothetical protein
VNTMNSKEEKLLKLLSKLRPRMRPQHCICQEENIIEGLIDKGEQKLDENT